MTGTAQRLRRTVAPLAVARGYTAGLLWRFIGLTHGLPIIHPNVFAGRVVLYGYK